MPRLIASRAAGQYLHDGIEQGPIVELAVLEPRRAHALHHLSHADYGRGTCPHH